MEEAGQCHIFLKPMGDVMHTLSFLFTVIGHDTFYRTLLFAVHLRIDSMMLD